MIKWKDFHQYCEKKLGHIPLPNEKGITVFTKEELNLLGFKYASGHKKAPRID